MQPARASFSLGDLLWNLGGVLLYLPAYRTGKCPKDDPKEFIMDTHGEAHIFVKVTRGKGILNASLWNTVALGNVLSFCHGVHICAFRKFDSVTQLVLWSLKGGMKIFVRRKLLKLDM